MFKNHGNDFHKMNDRPTPLPHSLLKTLSKEWQDISKHQC